MALFDVRISYSRGEETQRTATKLSVRKPHEWLAGHRSGDLFFCRTLILLLFLDLSFFQIKTMYDKLQKAEDLHTGKKFSQESARTFLVENMKAAMTEGDNYSFSDRWKTVQS